MNIPCSSTPGLCNDPSNPVVNISSERDDVEIFYWFTYGDGTFLPPIGSIWDSVSSEGMSPPGDIPPWPNGTLVDSPPSVPLGPNNLPTNQQDARILSEGNFFTVLSANWPVTNPLNPKKPGPRPVYFNTEQSCQVACPNGDSFNYTVPAGTYFGFSQTSADSIAMSHACAAGGETKICMTTGNNPSYCEQDTISFDITASGGNGAAFTFSISGGDFPVGVVMTQTGDTTASVVGPAVGAGNYVTIVQAEDSVGNFQQIVVTFSVVGIANSSPLPDASTGVFYTVGITAEGPTQGDLAWSVIGTLPDGLGIDPVSGVISGTPTGIDLPISFSVQMEDENATCQKDFTISPPSNCGPDWSTISWDAPIFQGDGAGSSVGDTVSGSCSGISDPFAPTPGTAYFHGTVTYNGPSFVCNVHISANPTTVGNVNDSQFSGNITMGPDTFSPGIQNLPNPVTIPPGKPPGTYDIQFTFPDTGGMDMTVDIVFSANAGIFGFGGSGAVSVSGSMTISSTCP